MMLVSCSGDVFLRPGQLRAVLAKHSCCSVPKPKKSKPNKKKKEDMGVLGRFWVLFFRKSIIFGDRRNRNRANPTIIWNFANTVLLKLILRSKGYPEVIWHLGIDCCRYGSIYSTMYIQHHRSHNNSIVVRYSNASSLLPQPRIRC